MTASTAFGQTKSYIGLGASYSQEAKNTYNVEVGCQTAKTWYSLIADITNKTTGTYQIDGKSRLVPKLMLGAKLQHSVCTLSPKSSMFGFVSVKGGRYEYVDMMIFTKKENFLQVEPGLSTSFNVDKHVGLQAMLSTYFNNQFKLTGSQWPLRVGVLLTYNN